MTPIVDTGPLVALFDRSDRHHQWACEVFAGIKGPLVTCESVVAEVLFLCARNRVGTKPMYALLETRALRVAPVLVEAPDAVARLLRRYAPVPMSLADAGVLHLHQTVERSVVLTCDSGFRIYRRRGARAVNALVPDGV